MLSMPLDVCVNSSNRRCSNSLMRVHQVERRSASASFYELEPDLYIPDGATLFFQMAEILDAVDLVLLGYELSSKFAVSQFRSNSLIPSEALLSLAAVSDEVKAESGLRARNIRRTLPYIRSGAESPPEIEQAAKLLLSQRLGGMGLDNAILNPSIELSENARAITLTSTCRPDLLFPDIKYAVEYLGAEWHSSPDQRLHDAMRVNALAQDGFIVRELDSSSVKNPDAVLEIAKEVHRLRGTRFQISIKNFAERQEALFKRLNSANTMIENA